MNTFHIAVAAVLLAGSAVAQSAPDARRAAQDMRQEGRLKAGDPAPDFDLLRRGGEGRVRLSAFKDQKPVALIFGSYT